MKQNKDYNEICKEIRGSDLPPEKLEYTVPDHVKVEKIPRGVSGRKNGAKSLREFLESEDE